MYRAKNSGMILVTLVLMCLPITAPANDMQSTSSPADSVQEGSRLYETIPEEEFARHGIGAFLGYSFTPDSDEFTIGVDYEFRFSKYLGVGLMYDYVGGDIDKSLIALPFYIHPGGVARVVLAPAMEMHEDENEFLFRSGLIYDLYLHEKFLLSPTAYMDIVKNHMTVVVGLTLGTEF